MKDSLGGKRELTEVDVRGRVVLIRLNASKSVGEAGKPYNYSAWFDFSKAYDSIHHWQLLRLIRALPVPDGVVQTLIAAVRRWSAVVVGRSTTNPIRIARGYTLSWPSWTTSKYTHNRRRGLD